MEPAFVVAQAARMAPVDLLLVEAHLDVYIAGVESARNNELGSVTTCGDHISGRHAA